MKGKKRIVGVMLFFVLMIGIIFFIGVRQQTAFDGLTYPVQAAEQAKWSALLNELPTPKDVEMVNGQVVVCGSRIGFGNRAPTITGFQDFTSGNIPYGCNEMQVKQGDQLLYTGPSQCTVGNKPGSDYNHPLFSLQQYINSLDTIVSLKRQNFVTGQVLTSPTYFYEGAVNVVKVAVTSEYATSARLIAWVQGQNEGYDLTKADVLLQQGTTDFEFILPDALRIAELYTFVIVPVHRIPHTTSGTCRSQSYMAYGDPIRMDFQVNPKPVWQLRDPSIVCDGGYEPQFEGSELCLLARWKNEGCSVTGCPITVCPKDVAGVCAQGDRIGYECGSNGFCSEPIIKVSEADACKDLGKVYDNQTGACYSTAYFSHVLDCTADADCPNACPGQIMNACVEGRCQPSGSCNPPTIEEVRTVMLQNENLQKQPENPIQEVVIREVVILPPSNTFKIIAGVLGFLVAVLVFILLLIFSRRKRR